MKLQLGEFFNDDKITVQIDDPPSKSVSVNLNPKDNLSKIREKLKQNSEVEMDDTLSFAIKNSGTNKLAVIAREDEESNILNDTIERNNKILYLQKNPKPRWKYLNDKLRLDYGCTIISGEFKETDYGHTIISGKFVKADKRAFEMKDCDIIVFEEYQKENIEKNLAEERIMKTELSLTGNIDVQDFAKLGCSIGRLKNENSKSEASSFCNFMEFSKASLKFRKYLEPTPEFLKAVKDAIESKNHRKFKEITEDYGRFIPDEVILGGKAYHESVKNLKDSSKGKTNKAAMSGGVPALKFLGGLDFGIGHISENSRENTDNCEHECFKYIGGNQSNDEKAWIESLKDFRNWDCIKFHNPISIFQLLSKDLQEQIFFLVGKKILYSKIEDYEYDLKVHGKPIVADELKIPPDISKIIQNKDADCNFFATVLDTEEKKDDIFNCQILCPPDGRPRFIIHCIQKKFQERKCKLKIRWMIISYDLNFNFIHSDLIVQLRVLKTPFKTQSMDSKDFLNYECNSVVKEALCFGIPILSKLDSSNSTCVIGSHFFNQEENKIGLCTFSYCSKRNCYINLPDFTFYTLIISDYPTSNAYDLHYLKFPMLPMLGCPFIDLKESNCLNPKYVSLYLSKNTNYNPIFLNQKSKKVKIEYAYCSCNRTCFICTNRKLKISEDERNRMCYLNYTISNN